MRLKGRTRAILRRVPDDRPLIGAELGVFTAKNSCGLFHERPQLVLNLIDLWGPHPGDSSYVRSGDGVASLDARQWRKPFRRMVARIGPYHGRWRILQGWSHEIAALFGAASLDFVFVDADHSYDGTRRDIDAWWPKVKPGGWLGGHDYDNPWPDRKLGPDAKTGESRWGVKKAVAEFLDQEPGLELELDEDFTWFVAKARARAGRHIEAKPRSTAAAVSCAD